MNHHKVSCHCGECLSALVNTINQKQNQVQDTLQDFTAEQIVRDVLNGDTVKANEHIQLLDEPHFMKLRATLDVTIQLMDKAPDISVAA